MIRSVAAGYGAQHSQGQLTCPVRLAWPMSLVTAAVSAVLYLQRTWVLTRHIDHAGSRGDPHLLRSGRGAPVPDSRNGREDQPIPDSMTHSGRCRVLRSGENT